MRFHDAIAYLDDHDNLEKAPGGPTAGVVHGLSLDRMRGIVEVLGDPHRCAPVIHVTGTNGKGSTTRMIAALLGAHGLTVGTYGSPHVESITERLQRNGEPISEDDFASVMAEIAAVESLFPDRPSYFDLLTAAAFSWFAREAVDVMVVEVGMLGRYDSTNVVEADVAVVTNVGRDHTDGIGDWRRAIAEEKAGIIGASSAVVIGETEARLVDIFRAEGGASHWVRDIDFGVRRSAVAFGGRLVDLYTPSGPLEELFVPVHGAHQADNAATAVAAVEAFFGRPVDPEVAREGLAAVEMPARCEVMRRSPLVVIDMAHNPEGMAATAETLRSEFAVDGPLVIVVGALRGRPLPETFGALASLAPARVVCTTAASPRAVPADELAEVLGALVPASCPVDVVVDVDDAIRRAVDALPDNGALVVTGSVYVAGDARRTLRDLDLV